MSLPELCCVLPVSSRLRNALSAYADAGLSITLDTLPSEVKATVIEDLNAAPIEALYLPLPKDGRLRDILSLVMGDPTVRISRAMLAAAFGKSEQTLDRLMRRETGLGLAQWRQRLSLIASLHLIAASVPISQVAAQLGYASTGGFIKMFRRMLGEPPARYGRSAQRRDVGA